MPFYTNDLQTSKNNQNENILIKNLATFHSFTVTYKTVWPCFLHCHFQIIIKFRIYYYFSIESANNHVHFLCHRQFIIFVLARPLYVPIKCSMCERMKNEHKIGVLNELKNELRVAFSTCSLFEDIFFRCLWISWIGFGFWCVEERREK